MINILALQHELAELEAQHKENKRRRNEIRKILKKHNAPSLRENDYYNKPLYLYVLELEQSKYYVGMTRNVDARFKRHSKGKGAAWTKLYKPLRVIQRINTGLIDESEVALLEDELTIDIGRQYGFENVRGGQWCTIRCRFPLRITSPDNWIKVL